MKETRAMMRLGKKPTCPARLTSDAVIEAKDAIRCMYEKTGKVKTKDFQSRIWLCDDVRLKIHSFQHGKCVYCERKREVKWEADIEHFRPKAEVTDENHPGYWWLAYEWSNLYFSCKPCNQGYKKNKFPLRSNGVRAKSEADNLAAELPILPDPCAEDPEQLIAYVSDANIEEAWPVGRGDQKERGGQVIKILGLDRDLLNRLRGELMMGVLRPLAEKMNAATYIANFGNDEFQKEAAKDIKRETACNREFASFRRKYFSQMGLGKYVSTD